MVVGCDKVSYHDTADPEISADRKQSGEAKDGGIEAEFFNSKVASYGCGNEEDDKETCKTLDAKCDDVKGDATDGRVLEECEGHGSRMECEGHFPIAPNV